MKRGARDRSAPAMGIPVPGRRTVIDRRQFLVAGLASAAACSTGRRTPAYDTSPSRSDAQAASGLDVPAPGPDVPAAAPDAATPGRETQPPAPDAPPDRAAAADAGPPADGIVDVHTHFLYGGAVSPAAFADMVRPLGVVATVVVEAGTNNEAILALADANPIIVGFSGHLDLGSDGFKDQLRKLASNRFFRGVRSYGWEKPANTSDLAALAELDLELDCLTGPDGLLGVADAARRVPSLRFVINHLGQPKYPGGPVPADFVAKMEAVAEQPNVWVKVSSLRTLGGSTAEFWRPMLDELWRIFGKDRLMFGSNYPVSPSYAAELAITRQYLAGKPRELADKFYAQNARAAYRWIRQPGGSP